MKLFLFGYFGCGNLGDEAILKSFLDWAAENLPAATCMVQTSDTELTRKQYGVETVHKFNMTGLFRAIRGCNAVVAPGGGLLQDATSSRSLRYYLGIMRLAQFFGKPVFLLSQGIGPLNNPRSRRVASRVLRRCRFVAVRDDASADLLKTLGIPDTITSHSGDLALLSRLPEHAAALPARAPGRPLKVGLSLRPDKEVSQTAGTLIECLLRLNARRPLELELFPMSRGDDLPLLDDFAARIKGQAPAMSVRMIGGRDENMLSVEDMENAVAGLDVMVGMRLHSLVFSARGGVPFAGLSYDPKVTAFALACRQPVVENLKQMQTDEIFQKIETAIERGDECREAMTQALTRSRESLLENMDRFKDRLDYALGGPRRVLGIPVSARNYEETIEYLYETVRRGNKLHVVTLNPEMILNARKDAAFRSLLQGVGLLTADGIGVRLAYKFKHGKTIGKAPGVEILDRLLKESHDKKIRLFLLGSKPEVIEAAVARAKTMRPRPSIAGYHDGYIKNIDQEKLIEQINGTRPNVLFVGMGSPFQEQWIHENMEKITANVFVGVGGSFDVLSGAVKRAPVFFQKLGLEWFYRLVTQPSRIGRMAGFPFFMLLAVWDAMLFRMRGKRE